MKNRVKDEDIGAKVGVASTNAKKKVLRNLIAELATKRSQSPRLTHVTGLT